LSNLASLAATEGAYERARKAAAQAQALAQTIGDRFTEAVSHMLMGHGLAGLGRTDAAAAAYRVSCDLYHAAGRADAAVEALAGLARLALGQGDIAEALAQVEPILIRLAQGDAEPSEEILRVDLTCYQVLRAANDPRAASVLEAAYAKLQEQAAKITDEAMRRSFLENVPYHHAIVAAWAEVIHADH
jgi:tetratricopeptide (TPR) repeat protein